MGIEQKGDHLWKVRIPKSMKTGIIPDNKPWEWEFQYLFEISKLQGISHDVSIFLMYDGVYNVNKKEFADLVDKGVDIAICAFNAEQRKLLK